MVDKVDMVAIVVDMIEKGNMVDIVFMVDIMEMMNMVVDIIWYVGHNMLDIVEVIPEIVCLLYVAI